MLRLPKPINRGRHTLHVARDVNSCTLLYLNLPLIWVRCLRVRTGAAVGPGEGVEAVAVVAAGVGGPVTARAACPSVQTGVRRARHYSGGGDEREVLIH